MGQGKDYYRVHYWAGFIMGMELNLMAVRLKSPDLLPPLEKNYRKTFKNTEGFFVVSQSTEYPHGTTPRSWGSEKLSRGYGEAIYLYYYDGPAGELCGTILYEHSIDGNIVRALGFCPRLWKDEMPDPERNMWRRVEGAPEPWEPSVFPFSEEELKKSLAEAADYGSPSADDVEAIWAEKTLKEGNYFPGNVQDHLLGGVKTHFKF